MIRTLCIALAAGLLPIAASAQTGGSAPDLAAAEQTSQGPMIVERVHNGFLVAPDFKFTEIDHKSSGLAGGYAGFVFDEHFFIGGGGYALATQTRGRDLAYGGLVLQWLGAGNDTFGFSAKTLFGGGRADSSGTLQVLDHGRTISESYRARQNFLVAEPELDALIRMTDHLRLAVGAGYRFTGSDWGRRNPFDIPGQRLNGAVGSISLQIGGGM
jgi:hypothetical protein